MRNIRKIFFGFLMIVAICYTTLAEGHEAYGPSKIRVRRGIKDSEKKSEKHNKQDAVNGRSQLNGQDGSPAQLTANPSGGYADDQQIANRISGKFLGMPPSGGAYPINNPFMGPPLPNYAATFPYPGMAYPSHPNMPGQLPPPNNLGYFYGNPTLQATSINPVIHNGNNFVRPPFAGGLIPQAPPPPPPGPYANNFMNYASFPADQQAVPILPNGQGVPVNPMAGPQYSVHNVQTAPSSLQLQAFAQRQSDYVNPFAGGFPYPAPQQDRFATDFGMPIGYFTGYPRFQRSLKLKKDK